MAEEKKIKILTLSDHPLSPSGVGTQTRLVIEALLKSGKFKVVSFGGAIKHKDYKVQKTDEYQDDWVIYPVDAYGNQEMVRSVLRTEKPDMLWFMTDPRFYGWLWMIENEIRPHIPMVYYHVWDNLPYPTFNKSFYDSTDVIATISKVTDDIVRTVSPSVECHYIPHAVDPNIFKKLPNAEIKNFKHASFPNQTNKDKFVFFWNNRNARRKQSGSLIFWFKQFLDEADAHDKACLIMHTDPRDEHGQDLQAIMEHLDLDHGQVMLSTQKMPQEGLAMLYNMADCTVNISDAEGFGLATLESLSCETPIIVNMTGGLQEQVTDGKEWFGIGLEPSSKAVIGSQDVPWIYEDRLDGKELVAALKKMYEMSPEKRATLGKLGRQHLEKNYNYDNFKQQWVDLTLDIHKRYGAWENRKNYKSWELIEVA